MILCTKHNSEIIKTRIENPVFEESYDVIVVGLGTAGSIAAICAAEYGLSVLALETGEIMGGTATAGCVLGYFCGNNGGRYEAIDEIIYQTDKDLFTTVNNIFPDHIHPWHKALVLESEALKAGVDIRFGAWAFGVYLEDKKVVGLKWKDDKGIHSTRSKYVIDCTGDANICAIAGCETSSGRDFDGRTQPFSLCTLLIKDGNLNSYYVDNGYIDPCDSNNFSRTILNTYTQKMFLWDNARSRSYYPVIAPLAGIRAGRRIIGEENVTLKDFSEGRVTDKPLFYAYSHIDTHGIEHAFEGKLYIEWCIVSRLKMLVFSVPIPKGALIPKGYKGILAAGRCIGVDHDISSCVRMKRDMQKCGEAASALAFLSVRDNVDALDVGYDHLVKILKRTKCLDENNNRMTFRVGETPNGVKFDIPVKWLTDKNEIKNQLEGPIPGIGIWSAKRLGNAVIGDLKHWFDHGNGRLKKYSAITLGLMGDNYSVETLREIIKKYPPFEDMSMDDIFDGLSAIYLLGELCDDYCLPYLEKIIKSDSDNNNFFQFFLYAMTAIVKILGKTKNNKTKNQAFSLLAWIIENKKEFPIFLSEREMIRWDISEQIRNYIQNSPEYASFKQA